MDQISYLESISNSYTQILIKKALVKFFEEYKSAPVKNINDEVATLSLFLYEDAKIELNSLTPKEKGISYYSNILLQTYRKSYDNYYFWYLAN